MAAHLVRKEKAGSIFYRVTGLIRAKQLKWEDRPLWYDIYVVQPPLVETVWNKKYPKEKDPVKSIFYKEDKIRAEFYKRIQPLGAISIENTESKSLSQVFIDKFLEEEKRNPLLSSDELFEKTKKEVESLGFKLKERAKKSSLKK